MGPVNIHEAKTRFSQLIERVERGEEIVIARGGKPVARLVPLEAGPRALGRMRGRIRVADDFDAPLPPEELAALAGQEPVEGVRPDMRQVHPLGLAQARLRRALPEHAHRPLVTLSALYQEQPNDRDLSAALSRADAAGACGRCRASRRWGR